MYDLMKLSDFIEINPKVRLEKGKEYQFVDMGSVEPGNRYVKAKIDKIFMGGGAKFQSGDTLFARITPCLENGKIAQFRAPDRSLAFGSTEFFIFRNISELSDPGFVYYLAKSDLIRKPAEKSMSGASGRQRADVKSICNLEIPSPPLHIQKRIASILSAYDNLIENNTRRIQILEEMTQRIYQEWFVDFRFPGHENVKIVDSELGMIPEGWEVKTASEAIYINPREKIPKGTYKAFVAMGGLSTTSMKVTQTGIRTGNSGAKFRNGDTLFARITPCLENGKTGFVQFLDSDSEVGLGSTEFIVLRSKTVCPEYVYLLSRSEPFRENAILSMTGASGRQRVRYECFDNYRFAHPDYETLYKFSKIAHPLFRLVWVLHDKNQYLRKARDLLLPKLISGQIDVSHLDIHTGELAA